MNVDYKKRVERNKELNNETLSSINNDLNSINSYLQQNMQIQNKQDKNIKNYSSLINYLHSLTTHQKGIKFEEIILDIIKKSKDFEDIESAWLWNDYPDKDDSDTGIDIVAKGIDNKLIAIQCKCYDKDNKKITKRDIDSFLNKASSGKYDEKILFTTSYISEAHAHKALKEHKVIIYDYDELAKINIKWSKTLDKPVKKEKAITIGPREYQQEAIDKTIDMLKSKDKAQLIMACGTGKTLTSLWLNEQMDNKKTLILVPSLVLLSQFSKSWKNYCSEDKIFSTLAVCSDSTVLDGNQENNRNINNKEIIKQNLIEQGIIEQDTIENVFIKDRVTQDVYDIIKILENDSREVVFSTYQSSDLIVYAQKQCGIKFDLVIADEAHKCASNSDSYYTNVLDDKKIQSKKKIFLTATPKIYKSRLALDDNKKDNSTVAYSMDNYDKFGEIAFHYPFSTAIEKDILSKYELLVFNVDQENLDNNLMRKFQGQNIDNETLLKLMILIKAYQNYNISKIITFHTYVKYAEQFANSRGEGLIKNMHTYLTNNNEINQGLWCSSVNGKQSSKERENILQQINQHPDKLKIITNARCLTEGIDIPSLDAIAFIDPKKSPVDIIQAIGRVIRKSPGKEKGYIILPIIGDNNKTKNFEAILNIVNALKAHDPELERKLNQYRIKLALNKADNNILDSIEDSINIKFNNIDNIQENTLNEEDNQEKEKTKVKDFSAKEFQELTLNILKNTTDNWFDYYIALSGYIKNNSLPEHDVYVEIDGEEESIYKWVKKQRQLYNKQTNISQEDEIEVQKNSKEYLTIEQIQYLEDIPEWRWIESKKNYLSYLYIKNYVINNRAYPEQSTENITDPDCFKGIGKWYYKKLEDSYSLARAEKEALDEIEDSFNWLTILDEVSSFFNNQNLTFNFQYGLWLKNQIDNKKNNILATYQEEQLALEKFWNIKNLENIMWKETINNLKTFLKEYKIFPDENYAPYLNIPLLRWYNTQLNDIDLEQNKKQQIIKLERYKEPTPEWLTNYNNALLFIKANDELPDDKWFKQEYKYYSNKDFNQKKIDKFNILEERFKWYSLFKDINNIIETSNTSSLNNIFLNSNNRINKILVKYQNQELENWQTAYLSEKFDMEQILNLLNWYKVYQEAKSYVEEYKEFSSNIHITKWILDNYNLSKNSKQLIEDQKDKILSFRNYDAPTKNWLNKYNKILSIINNSHNTLENLELEKDLNNWLQKELEKYESKEYNKIKNEKFDELMILNQWIKEFSNFKSQYNILKNESNNQQNLIKYQPLIYWINNQSKLLNKGELSETQIKLFTDAFNKNEIEEFLFEKEYNIVLNYLVINKIIPESSVIFGNIDIKKWIDNKEDSYTFLSAKSQELFDNIDYYREPDQNWNYCYNQNLKWLFKKSAFIQKEENPQLFEWFNNNRNKLKSKDLHPLKIQRLETLNSYAEWIGYYIAFNNVYNSIKHLNYLHLLETENLKSLKFIKTTNFFKNLNNKSDLKQLEKEYINWAKEQKNNKENLNTYQINKLEEIENWYWNEKELTEIIEKDLKKYYLINKIGSLEIYNNIYINFEKLNEIYMNNQKII